MKIRSVYLRFSFLFVCLSCLYTYGYAQIEWKNISNENLSGEMVLPFVPEKYTSYTTDFPVLRSFLRTAPAEGSVIRLQDELLLQIPDPQGNLQEFIIRSTEVMHPDLAAQFPEIGTFIGLHTENKLITARFDFTLFGFHGMIMSPDGWYFIEPASLSNPGQYMVYYRRDMINRLPLYCGVSDTFIGEQYALPDNTSSLRVAGSTLKTYRLAVACTGEYAAFYGGTVSGAMSGITTSVNRVNGVYEKEVTVRMVLIANNSSIIYTNSSTDPYTNSNGSTMLGQNQTTIDAVIGTANYDIGHVFSTGGGGVASLGSVCSSSNKARGVTGSGAPVGDAFDIDYVAHEIGHQFGGNHTFNSTTGSCGGGNRSSTSAYEPGSGTTIMAYAGICGADNIQSNSDPIFHTKSFDEIQNFITTGNGNNCDVASATGNNPPVVNPGSNYTVPISTPFILTGSATDADSDPLLYLWEQYDLGASGSPNSPSGNAPIFRVFTPVASPSRTFPRIQDLVRNTQTLGEILPSYARNLQFKFTARDNRSGGGGVGNNETPVTLTVVNNGGAFTVTSPNTNITWTGNTNQTVTWNVSGTDLSPINCSQVNILFSVDSGYTWPYTLATATANDGSEIITVPNIASTKARVKVEAVGNIFFDISNVNFTLVTGGGAMTSITTSALAASSYCAGASVNVGFSTNGTPNAGNIYTAQLSNASGSFASPVNIGSLSSTSSTGTIAATIPGGTTNGSGYRIRVISSNPAVTGSNNGTNISITQPVTTTGTISGTATVCQGQSGVVYAVPALTNASSYNWTLPSGATITSGSGTNSITVSFSPAAVSGNITVAGSNVCGDGPVSASYAVLVNMLPAQPGAIAGTFSVCQGANAVAYSIATVPGASSYAWIVPSGASIASGSGTNSITVNYSPVAVSGTISVSAVNGCGTGTASTVSVDVYETATAPTISASGSLNICSGGNVNLSFTALPDVFYQWRYNAVPISGANANSYLAGATGNYDVLAAAPLIITNSTSVSIPDNSCTGAFSSISVSGFSGTISSSNIKVSLNITHPYVGDLVAFLEAPNGAIVGLINRVGGSGDNFVNTVFSDAGSVQIPATGTPYTNTYKPWTTTFTSCITSTVTTFNAIGGGAINPNGNWTLRVYDRAAADLGTITSWSLFLPGSLGSPCLSSSNVLNVTVSAAPSIVSMVPSSGVVGSTISIFGSGFTGTTQVTFNGTAAAFSIINDGELSATVPAGASSGTIVVTTSCGSANSPGAFTVIPPSVSVQLKVLIDGFYLGNGKMRGILSNTVCDTITLSLAASTSPYALTYTLKQVIDTAGNGTFVFPGAVFGQNWYLVVRHRNSIETWSASAINFNQASMSYNFSTSAGQAFAGNQRNLGDGRYAIWSGNINQDSQINFSDYSLFEISASGFSTGYVPADLNGDGIVETADHSLLENNIYLNISLQKP